MVRLLAIIVGVLLFAVSLNLSAWAPPQAPDFPLQTAQTPSPNATATATGTATQTAATATLAATPTGTPAGTPSPTAVPRGRLFYFPAAYYQLSPSPPDCIPRPHIPATSLSSEATLTGIFNSFRDEAGLSTLAWASGPTQASRRHAGDMARNGVEGFTGSDGSNPGQRLREACYDWVVVGQIIGWGFADPAVMAASWLGSPAHTALILDTRYDDLGPAYAFDESSRWRHYWAVTFAQPAGPNIRSSPGSSYSCTETLHWPGGGSLAIWNQKEPCP